MVRNAAVLGDLGTDPEVFGVRHDSRAVEKGELFVTWSGAKFDGRLFAGQAIERGAVAVLADRPRPAETPREIPWLETVDPRGLLGDLAAPLYGHPDRDLTLIGVTGTNGKSTVVELCANILEAAGSPCGRIGTLGYHFGGDDLEGEAAGHSGRTTPEASDLFRLLAEMRDRGARAVAMEVSSHALVQGRVTGAGFDVAVFTNLTRDHLDFHGDLESYFSAKRRLFEMRKPGGKGVTNLDDAYGRRLAEEFGLADTFGSSGSGAAVRPAGVDLDGDGMRGALATPRGPVHFRSPLLGRYNLSNLLAAAAVAEALELPQEFLSRGIEATRTLPGRMDAVRAGQPFLAVVDYAHTDAALGAAIRSLRELTGTKVVVVFGCGGDRDPGKRPMMGRIAGDLADLPIATSDNPRSEDPLAILSAVEEGLKASTNRNYRIVPDRREAIRRAVTVAMAGGWSILVAGKGHENEQIVGNQRLPFSDRNELERAIAEQRGGGGRG
ncbi:MAG: UDP-N-acetylmuramoyl-L-alanyl-D-glutamate--2,6-diaminopimelate ligase [Thermoanaerobaculia bacterium]